MMMTRALVASLLVAAAPALASPADDTAFQADVTKSAADDARWIEAWGTINLDNDAALERYALVCQTDGDDKHGYFIVEKDATHRWEQGFDVTSHTRACQKKPDAAPKWEPKKEKTLDERQDHFEGYDITSFAIRAGGLVIVREESSSGKAGEKPVVSDYDQLLKQRKRTAYQTTDQTRALPPR